VAPLLLMIFSVIDKIILLNIRLIIPFCFEPAVKNVQTTGHRWLPHLWGNSRPEVAGFLNDSRHSRQILMHWSYE
jgi:hypothetical protein